MALPSRDSLDPSPNGRPESDPDPRPGIRKVVLAGFLSGNVVAGAYLAILPDFWKALIFEPLYILPYLFGGFLAFGVVGMFTGTFAGLATKLLREKLSRSPGGWPVPVGVSCSCSATIGLLGIIWLFALMRVK